GAELVTTHGCQRRGHATRLEHYPMGAQAFMRATPAVCRARAEQVGPATVALVAPLLATRTQHRLREVQAVLRLLERYKPQRLEAACQRALQAGDGRLRTVRGLLASGWDQLVGELEPVRAPVAGAFLRSQGAFAAPAAPPGVQAGRRW